MKPREITLESGTKILLGKNAENNEELVNQFIGKNNVVLHTAKPGSPFCVIEDKKLSKKDIHETAILCASKSQDWRDNKGNVEIHVFNGRDVYKEKRMKLGTFGVNKFKVIKIKKKEIEEFLK